MKKYVLATLATLIALPNPVSAEIVTVSGHGTRADAPFDFSASYDTENSKIYNPIDGFTQYYINEFTFSLNGTPYTVTNPAMTFASSSNNRSIAIFGQSTLPTREYVTLQLSAIPTGTVSTLSPPLATELGSYANYRFYFGQSLANISMINISSVASAIPEPSTWLMMIFGFGAIGLSIRTKRSVARLKLSTL